MGKGSIYFNFRLFEMYKTQKFGLWSLKQKLYIYKKNNYYATYDLWSFTQLLNTKLNCRYHKPFAGLLTFEIRF